MGTTLIAVRGGQQYEVQVREAAKPIGLGAQGKAVHKATGGVKAEVFGLAASTKAGGA